LLTLGTVFEDNAHFLIGRTQSLRFEGRDSASRLASPRLAPAL
jgi:hypothetical protein